MDWRTRPDADASLQVENRKQPDILREIPREAWPENARASDNLLRVLRSRDFLVQVFRAPAPATVRLSVNRTKIVAGRWADGISWDELQRLKTEAGFPTEWAVELFPSALEVVNVANIRHLWLLPEPPAFAWRRGACA